MKRYTAVSIVTRGDCCETVKGLIDVRILAAEAPLVLPLPDCSMPERCKCRYVKYPDRRSEDGDRREEANDIWYKGSERRKSVGRRKDD